MGEKVTRSSQLPLSVQDVRPLNRSALLRCLRDVGPLTRANLARSLQLSHSTVTNVATELLGEGLLVDDASDGVTAARVGRPSTELAIAASARHVMGIQVGVGFVRGGTCDLLGRVVDRSTAEFPASSDAEPAVQAILRVVHRLLTRSTAQPLGVGVGAPGPVDRDRRVNLMAINLGWRDVPFAELLEQQLDLPVVVDHNVRAMALGESRFGLGRGASSLALVYLRTGVGAGVVVDGRAFRGGIHGVIELGHLPLVSDGPRCGCGNRGCLEALVAEPAIEKEVARLARRHASSRLRAALEAGERPTHALLTAARAGDRPAVEFCGRFIDQLAVGLVSLVNLLNPEVIVGGGYLAEAGDQLLAPLAQRLSELVYPVLRPAIRVEPASFGADTGVVGAATLALDEFFYEHSSLDGHRLVARGPRRGPAASGAWPQIPKKAHR